jgi:DNA primase
MFIKAGLTKPEQQLQDNICHTHFLSKITAIGYLLHTFKDPSKEKAVVAMDGVESEVGESEGRTGKSLMGQALNKVLNTAYINGKNFENDRYPWEEVDERTDLIFIDDVNPNYNFELLFPQITGKFQVEKKGIAKFTIPKEESPKIFITTNHALKGDGSSFKDRQHLIGFSDYFNDARKPIDVYHKRFFDEWDFDQWNAFYNFMAECIHIYLKHGLIKAPEENLDKRKQRQTMGEVFLEWAEEFYSDVNNLNIDITKRKLYDYGEKSFLEKYPAQKRFTSPTNFKKKLKAYAAYKGYVFNPHKPRIKNGLQISPHGGDYKAGGIEYIHIATTI